MTPLLLATLVLGADQVDPPKLDIPANLRPAGRYVCFTPKSDTVVSVAYVGLSGVEPMPTELLKDPRTFCIDAKCVEPGEYKFLAVAAGETGLQVQAPFTVTIGTPPAPPPDVPPPAPTNDPLVKRFRDLFAADPGPADQKAAEMRYLAELYKQADGFAKASELATVGAVIARVQVARQSLKINGLLEVRKAIAAEMAALFPTDDPLTDDTRAKLAAAFARVSAALTAAGK